MTESERLINARQTLQLRLRAADIPDDDAIDIVLAIDELVQAHIQQCRQAPEAK